MRLHFRVRPDLGLIVLLAVLAVCGALTPLDPTLVATLRRDLLPRAAGSPFLTGGDDLRGVAFDGTHVWVTHATSPGSVAKLAAPRRRRRGGRGAGPPRGRAGPQQSG